MESPHAAWGLLCLLYEQISSVEARTSAKAQPLNLGGQRHIFIDEMLIAEMKGVSFQVRPPEMRETVLTPDHHGKLWKVIHR